MEDAPEEPPDEVVRLGALLGVSEGPGHLLLVGAPTRHAASLAALLDGVEVVALDPSLRTGEETPGVSRLAAGPGLPFFSRSLRGVALQGSRVGELLEEAVRVVGAGARVVVEEAPPGCRETLEEAGLQVILEEEGVVVATRGRGPGTGPRSDGVALPVFPGPPPAGGA